MVICHAAPAKVILTSEANHMRTSSIFLNTYLAIRTLADILAEEETPKTHNISAAAVGSVMPRLLAPKAGVSSTLLTDQS